MALLFDPRFFIHQSMTLKGQDLLQGHARRSKTQPKSNKSHSFPQHPCEQTLDSETIEEIASNSLKHKQKPINNQSNINKTYKNKVFQTREKTPRPRFPSVWPSHRYLSTLRSFQPPKSQHTNLRDSPSWARSGFWRNSKRHPLWVWWRVLGVE